MPTLFVVLKGFLKLQSGYFEFYTVACFLVFLKRKSCEGKALLVGLTPWYNVYMDAACNLRFVVIVVSPVNVEVIQEGNGGPCVCLI